MWLVKKCGGVILIEYKYLKIQSLFGKAQMKLFDMCSASDRRYLQILFK